MFFGKRRKKLLENEEENLKKLQELEDEDIKAIIIAGLITFVPAVILMLGAFYLIVWFLFLK
mgnify:CR=1 FL=1